MRSTLESLLHLLLESSSLQEIYASRHEISPLFITCCFQCCTKASGTPIIHPDKGIVVCYQKLGHKTEISRIEDIGRDTMEHNHQSSLPKKNGSVTGVNLAELDNRHIITVRTHRDANNQIFFRLSRYRFIFLPKPDRSVIST